MFIVTVVTEPISEATTPVPTKFIVLRAVKGVPSSWTVTYAEDNLLLKVVQSCVDKAPLLLALAVGKSKVCVEVPEVIVKSLLAVPTTIVWVAAVKVFNEVIPPPEAFKVVPTKAKFVPNVISSIIPAVSVLLPKSVEPVTKELIIGEVPPLEVNGATAATDNTPPPPPPAV